MTNENDNTGKNYVDADEIKLIDFESNRAFLEVAKSMEEKGFPMSDTDRSIFNHAFLLGAIGLRKIENMTEKEKMTVLMRVEVAEQMLKNK